MRQKVWHKRNKDERMQIIQSPPTRQMCSKCNPNAANVIIWFANDLTCTASAVAVSDGHWEWEWCFGVEIETTLGKLKAQWWCEWWLSMGLWQSRELHRRRECRDGWFPNLFITTIASLSPSPQTQLTIVNQGNVDTGAVDSPTPHRHHIHVISTAG